MVQVQAAAGQAAAGQVEVVPVQEVLPVAEAVRAEQGQVAAIPAAVPEQAAVDQALVRAEVVQDRVQAEAVQDQVRAEAADQVEVQAVRNCY